MLESAAARSINGLFPLARICLVSGEARPARNASMTTSTWVDRGAPASSPKRDQSRRRAPGTRPLATTMPRLILFRIAPVLIHAAPVSGHPLGAWCPYSGWPRRPTSPAVAGVVSARAPSARSALTVTSNGDLTLDRYAARE